MIDLGLLRKIMKKTFIFIANILLAISLLSCGKKIDSSVWLNNFEDAKKAARAENKRIFVFFSDDEGDGKSAKLKENLFNKEEFIKNYTEKYVLVNLDFSSSRADSYADDFARDARLLESYDADEIPFFFVLSKEGYFISQLVFEDYYDLDTARITFDEAEEEIKDFEDKLAKTKIGSVEERLNAIDELFNATDVSQITHLKDLSEQVLKLDKKNEYGFYINHAISLAYTNAQEFILDGNEEKGSEVFEKLSHDKNFNNDDKQMALYTAGYMLIQVGSTNYEKILGYFRQAYEIDPESESGQGIKTAMDFVQMQIDGEGDDLAENLTTESEELNSEELNSEELNYE